MLFSLLSLLFSITLVLNPDAVGNCDNNIVADPFTTPHNILPEWYFLLFYCCSRSYPNKNIGVAIVILLIMLFIYEVVNKDEILFSDAF